jgi:succinate dehydrogenase / fumarate reductase flavoprotein subunit
LHVLGEANFSDHGANRLGASALMQGLADGYFVIPYTLGHYFASNKLEKVTTDHEAFKEAEDAVRKQTDLLFKAKGGRTVDEFHKSLGKVMWNEVGMARTEKGLQGAIKDIRKLKEEFWQDVNVPGNASNYNVELHKATRVADFLELGELMALDALERNESCGGHFRTEFQTPDGEALRNDDKYCHVAAWEWTGKSPIRHIEELKFENVQLATRSYK